MYIKFIEAYKTPNLIDIRTKLSQWLRPMVGVDQTTMVIEFFKSKPEGRRKEIWQVLR